jgi:hypothetical protein
MNCKYGFYTCANSVEHMCDGCEDGDNYELKDEQDEMQELQGEV